MKRPYSVTVRGRYRTWAFTVNAEPEWVRDWREDGLEVDEVVNTIPVWAVELGLVRVWCWVQDRWNFRGGA
jgi:hypothetical protein